MCVEEEELVGGGCGPSDAYNSKRKTYCPILYAHQRGRNRSLAEVLGLRPINRNPWLWGKEGWAERSQATFDRIEQEFSAYDSNYAPSSSCIVAENFQAKEVPSKFKDDGETQLPSDGEKTKTLAMKHKATTSI